MFGVGESPFGIASSPTEQGFLLFTVKRAGTVTNELHNSEPGRQIGIRGPLGNTFPWRRMERKNIVIVSGGFAFTTLRSAITYMLATQRTERVLGQLPRSMARANQENCCIIETLKQWSAHAEMQLVLAVDPRRRTLGKGGLAWSPNVLKEVGPAAQNALALVLRPAGDDRFTIPVLLELVSKNRI